jgi:hypothetical protein
VDVNTLTPAGFPDEQEAGPVEKMCLARWSCGHTSGFSACASRMSTALQAPT